MSESISEALAHYSAGWLRLSAIDALIEELRQLRKELAEQQRSTANRLVREELAARKGEDDER